MAVSVAAVMRHCRNFFEVGYLDGTFRITGNALPDAKDAHFVYISGSLYHDGVWEICNGYLTGKSIEGLEDEEFDGRVWLLAPPIDFIETCKTIAEYEEKNPVGAMQSESFGEYSYTRQSLSGTNGLTGWQAAFGGQLAPYRRMFTEVR